MKLRGSWEELSIPSSDVVAFADSPANENDAAGLAAEDEDNDDEAVEPKLNPLLSDDPLPKVNPLLSEDPLPKPKPSLLGAADSFFSASPDASDPPDEAPNLKPVKQKCIRICNVFCSFAQVYEVNSVLWPCTTKPPESHQIWIFS